jgi:hypothetical protein
MKALMLIPFMLIAGCSTTTPVGHTLPNPPELIIEKCPNLKLLPEGETRLTELLKVVSENYMLYHECASKHDMLVKWYNEQKSIHDNIFNKK